MSKPDELLVDVAALVVAGQSNQMSLTVVSGGAVITGRLAPEVVRRQRVGGPGWLVQRGRVLAGLLETGGMYRVSIDDVSAWAMGDFSYSDH
ncbi:hypothetical protein ACF068_31525 [Streptomyces sp. NPDC016309]|uniref:hypothetical protein n=1 Tax=Streptomyces sp. NPDC016309 TaxID=3364965 RepID=UPI0037011B0A